MSDWPVKVGNPYQVLGQWYYPRDDRDYDQTGIASWYGPKFHGLSTANGETYDMDRVSAAHKTLPLPSYVEVTNLENGRRIIARVNDRGPFVGDRVIDLSRRSAELLDVVRKGTARVRVRRVYPPEDVRLALRGGGKSAGAVQMASAAPKPVRQPVPAPISQTAAPTPVAADVMTPAPVAIRTVSLPASSATGPARPPASPAPVAATFAYGGPSFIQVAAVSDNGRAEWLANYLKPFGTPVMQPMASGMIRVRIGPFTSVEDAQAALAKVHNAGYQEARIVVDAPAG
ncbi:septal ring lytic transglycosylase RlpA family protein [Tardibacter chloracetimidivorans]|uniref:septal ring lytic transglycosylase RlpA family protein n=1 Tax=Tardibacter chloracetimidivorans TaxID=1921510 RepID=UPI0022B259CF|nr:septal ring lytic transglycosylase RlpA family protein [Tardibacter chloracetimidivorans]